MGDEAKRRAALDAVLADGLADAPTAFEAWWAGLRAEVGGTTYVLVRAAWDAATERAAKVAAGAYTPCRSDGEDCECGGCVGRVFGDEIAARIRGGA